MASEFFETIRFFVIKKFTAWDLIKWGSSDIYGRSSNDDRFLIHLLIYQFGSFFLVIIDWFLRMIIFSRSRIFSFESLFLKWFQRNCFTKFSIQFWMFFRDITVLNDAFISHLQGFVQVCILKRRSLSLFCNGVWTGFFNCASISFFIVSVISVSHGGYNL